ncbi:GNAT family N-acetyltransferase [Clostridium sp. MD294]|uniref:GNAT family N-acetyltransferase n=1 Tax=Clostridium sp. MD294 TaxID=97138 RepID=UPI0002C8AF09|nr:GNAT family N-acetyltransferase [Clostridium sp. MD294]NDO46322.1 GNAT family N-acetyltransferase [Clostridium sp. MD294]USF29251.1 hypothetical protein C820_000636 [Clostridium sp. MD294]
MTKEIIKNNIEKLLSKQYCCSLEELQGDKIVYTVHDSIEKPYIKILAYQNCVVVCTSKNLHYKIQKLLKGKNRDEIFENPFVYGQTIHYVANTNNMCDISPLLECEQEYLFDKNILLLNGLTGFENSLTFDSNGFTSTKATYIAKHNNTIIGIAGASHSSIATVWEIGVDVIKEYRNARIASCLVSKLTKELLTRNIVPFYSASVTNIASQMVANKCNYVPFWVDTFGTILDGSSVYHDVVQNLIL